jgi:hypothetical protein
MRTAIYLILICFRSDCTVTVQSTAVVTGMMTITWRHEFLFCSFADLHVYLPQLMIMIKLLDLTEQVTRLDYVSECHQFCQGLVIVQWRQKTWKNNNRWVLKQIITIHLLKEFKFENYVPYQMCITLNTTELLSFKLIYSNTFTSRT